MIEEQDREATRDFIIAACLKLAVGGEERFDVEHVRAAFPASKWRSSEDQILAYLRASKGFFQCRRDVPSGDFILSKHAPTDDPELVGDE